MTRQATVRDLLDLRTGKPSAGVLIHIECGHRIAWSLMTDGAHCLGCSARWDYPWLLDRVATAGRPSYYQWTPPVEVHDEFGKFR